MNFKTAAICLAEYLQPRGFAVVEASTGQQALRFVRDQLAKLEIHGRQLAELISGRIGALGHSSGALAAATLAGGLGVFAYQFVGSSRPEANSTIRLRQAALLSSTIHKTQDSRAPRAVTKLVLSDVHGS